MADPSSIASLFLRYVASDIAQSNGTAVTTWSPRTGSGALSLSGSPTYQTASNVGAKPAVRFNGTSQFGTGTVTASGGTAITVVAILNLTSTSQQEVVQFGNVECLAGAPQWQIWCGSALNSSTNSTTGAHVVAWGASSSATTDFVYLDGASKATGDCGTPSSSTSLRICNWVSGGRFLAGDVAELLFFRAVLSTSELATVDSYAQDTYGITVADYQSSGINYSKTPADPLGLHDAETWQRTSRSAWSANAQATTQAAGPQNYTKTPADPLGLTDAVTVTRTYRRSPADPLGGTDAARLARGLTRADPLGATDTRSVAISGGSKADTLGITGTTTRRLDLVRPKADPLGITDTRSVARGLAKADPLGLHDTVTVARGYARPVTDSLGLHDTTDNVTPPHVANSVVIVELLGDAFAVTVLNDATLVEHQGTVVLLTQLGDAAVTPAEGTADLVVGIRDATLQVPGAATAVIATT